MVSKAEGGDVNRIFDNDEHQGLEVRLSIDEANQGTIHVLNQGGDVSGVGGRYFEPGAFGGPSPMVIVGSQGTQTVLQLSANSPLVTFDNGRLSID